MRMLEEVAGLGARRATERRSIIQPLSSDTEPGWSARLRASRCEVLGSWPGADAECSSSRRASAQRIGSAARGPFQCFVDALFEAGRKYGSSCFAETGACFKMASWSTDTVSPAECSLTCCHFIQHQAKRKQVRSGIQVLSPHLLRRHVGCRRPGLNRCGSGAGSA